MFKPFLEPSLAHEDEMEREQNEWLAKQKRETACYRAPGPTDA